MTTFSTTQIAVCNNCGEKVKNWAEYGGNKYCGACYNELFNFCEDCGDIYPVEKMKEIDGAFVCAHCYTKNWVMCYQCEKHLNLSRDTVLEGQDGHLYCRDCYYEIYAVCDICGEHFYREDMYDLDGQNVCESCYNENRVIKDHSYKPRPIFMLYSKKAGHKIELESVKSSTLFMGVELEVENVKHDKETNGVAAEIIEDYGLENLYIKYDGSLDDGFEIVTHPITIDGHKSESVIGWKKLLKRLMDNGFRSFNPGTCGLHVHVNRSQFVSQQRLYELKLSAIMLRLNQFIREASGRADFNYCQMINIDSKKLENVIYCKNQIADSRYYAINLMPTYTVEFRFPRGTLKYECFLGTLELISILVEIVNRYGLAYIMHKLSVNDVVKIARQNQYRYIFKLFSSRGVEI